MEQYVLHAILYVPHVQMLQHALRVQREELNCLQIYVVVMHHVLNVMELPVKIVLLVLHQDYY